jgi:hypothetical protein
VLLSCDLQESLTRVTIRQGQGSATPDIVRRMHDQFLAAEVDFAQHVIQTSGLTPADVVTGYDRLENLRVYILLGRQLFIVNPSRGLASLSHTLSVILFILGVVAIEPYNLTIAFKGKHVGGDPIEEPAIV